MTPKDESEKIEEVYWEIEWEGPVHDEELVEMGLESEEHIRRITQGLDSAGKILWTEYGWVAK